MFNCVIQSKVSQNSVEDIDILLSYKGILRSSILQPKHYALLTFDAEKNSPLKKKTLQIWGGNR